MREIKFRGRNYDGIWMYGYLIPTPRPQIHLGNKHCVCACPEKISRVDVILYEVEESTIGQYTGLKDKNGKEIYEGDIIHVKEFANEPFNVDFSFDDIRQLSLDDCKGRLLQEYKCIISFIDGNMMAKMISKEDCELYISSLFPDMRYSQPIFEFETIGNIHDNPELIKEVEI